MTRPFTPEQFFDVFARYNTTLWPAQVVLFALGALAIGFAVRGGRPNSRRASAIITFLWLWMAVAYHIAFFSEINPAAPVFAAAFVIQAAIVFWSGVLRSHLVFEGSAGVRRIAGGAIVAYAMIAYPLLNATLGHGYPRMPTFGLPCPTTIFTFGILLFAAPSVPRAAFIVPFLWTIVGTVAAIQFGVREDFGLAVAALAAIVLITVRHSSITHKLAPSPEIEATRAT